MNRVMQTPTAVASVAEESREFVKMPGGVPGAPDIRTDAVYVVYTTIEDTLLAARAAHGFAKVMGLPVTVLHFRAVPYSMPVDAPAGISPIETEAFGARLSEAGLNACLRVCLCRDEGRALAAAFKPHSLIVVGGRRNWWPTHAERIRRALEKAGHYVVFVDKETSHA